MTFENFVEAVVKSGQCVKTGLIVVSEHFQGTER